jgi:phosphoglucomutase
MSIYYQLNKIAEEIERLEYKLEQLKIKEFNLEKIQLKEWMKNKIYNDYVYNDMYCDMMTELDDIKNLKIVSRKLFLDILDKPKHLFDDLNILKLLFEYW